MVLRTEECQLVTRTRFGIQDIEVENTERALGTFDGRETNVCCQNVATHALVHIERDGVGVFALVPTENVPIDIVAVVPTTVVEIGT